MTTVKPRLSDEVFHSYLLCPYKSRLLLTGVKGVETQYAALNRELDVSYRAAAQRWLVSPDLTAIERKTKRTLKDLRGGQEVLLNLEIETDRYVTVIDAVRKAGGPSQLGAHHYEPLLFCRIPRVGKPDKLRLAFRAFVLGKAQQRTPEFGALVYGSTFTNTKVRLRPFVEQVSPMIESLLSQIDEDKAPHILLNRHCDVCDYKDRCRAEAGRADHLSLLKGISEREVEKHNSRGIFTVSQLSYTFRPRRYQYQSKSSPPHTYALQALSLREDKVHVNSQPKTPLSDTRIYVGIEGDPGRELYYLIGVLTVEGGRWAYHSFWANEECDQAKIAEQFVRFMSKFSGFRLYHFGSYDVRALKTMRSQVAACNLKSFDQCIENAVNVLPIIYHHFYFPVYSNSLKNVASVLGFRWTCTEPNAQQTIVWRHRWEQTGQESWKSQILDYNRDDCIALKKVVEFIEQRLDCTNRHHNLAANGPTVVRTDDMLLPDPYPQRFQRTEFEIPEWNYINECAYFDYQRDRVYLRTNPTLRRIANRNVRSRSTRRRLDKTVEIEVKTCPKCGGKKYDDKGPVSKVVVDLKFMRKGGVKK